MQNYKNTLDISKNLNLLKWFNFLAYFRFSASIAVLYFAAITNSYADALLVFSVVAISNALFEVPTGIYSDIIGRKKTIIYGQVISIMSVFTYFISNSFFILLVGAVLQGLAVSFFSGNNQALLFDTLKQLGKENDFSKYEGQNSSYTQISLGFSSLIAAGILFYLSSISMYKFLFLLNFIPLFIALFLTFKIVEPKIHSDKIKQNPYQHLKQAILNFKKNAKLRTLSIINIFEGAFGEAVYKIIPAFISLVWPVWTVPFFNFASNILAASGMYISHKVTKRFGDLKVLMFRSFTNSSLGIFMSVFVNIFSPILDLISGFIWGISHISNVNLINKELSDKERATMSSLNSLAEAIVFAIFAYSLGLAADKFGVSKTLICAYIISYLSLYFYWKLFKNEGKLNIKNT